jgi:hypothetical protein
MAMDHSSDQAVTTILRKGMETDHLSAQAGTTIHSNRPILNPDRLVQHIPAMIPTNHWMMEVDECILRWTREKNMENAQQ